MIVGQPEFLTRLNEMVTSVPVADWRTYLRWHVVHSMAPYLSSKFENEDFRFESGVLRGIKQQQPRWKRAVTAVDQLMGEALGRLYVEKYFKPAAKERMDELVPIWSPPIASGCSRATGWGRRRRDTRSKSSPPSRQRSVIRTNGGLLGAGNPRRFLC